MTVLVPDTASPVLADFKSDCAACRIILPVGELEQIPTRPWLLRCRDEVACRERYTPRRLARSVKGGEVTRG